MHRKILEMIEEDLDLGMHSERVVGFLVDWEVLHKDSRIEEEVQLRNLE